MSLYADYHKELGIKHVLETEDGFCTYSFIGQECYLEDIYVVPEKRKSRVAWDMADAVVEEARKMGCKYLTGSVIPQAQNATTSLKMLLSYGFRLLESKPHIISFVKEI